jgi:hypothetical protein
MQSLSLAGLAAPSEVIQSFSPKVSASFLVGTFGSSGVINMSLRKVLDRKWFGRILRSWASIRGKLLREAVVAMAEDAGSIFFKHLLPPSFARV